MKKLKIACSNTQKEFTSLLKITGGTLTKTKSIFLVDIPFVTAANLVALLYSGPFHQFTRKLGI